VALLYELVRVIRPSIVVEIGTFEGRTAQAIARALRRNGSGIIHTVSPFDRERFLPLFECWPEDVKCHARYHALSSMDFYIQADQERMRFDLVFVDGNHDYEFALFDIQAAATRMMPGGVIVIDTEHTTGTVHAQCILRGFGDDQIEVANEITGSIDSQQGSEVVSGQHILRLVAAGADGRHALGARFGDLAPSGIYRAVAWVKAEPDVRVMIEARDSVDSHTGNPSNYGVARFDLAARSVVDSTGDIIASGVEAAADDWVKLWVDLRSRDGEVFVTIRPLEGRNNKHVFKPTGQEVTFGGFEIFPPRVVKSVSQVGSPPPRIDIVTKVTNISELPPLPESISGPDRWDLIEGLSAEVVNEITLAVPITIKEMARYSVETWLTWDGTVPLKLRAPPAVY
jgi:predicted O-methyltransferase YrrM